MTFDELLSRLEMVRPRGNGTATARCPAHEDRLPSLAIRETDDGVLVYCHAGCSFKAICEAIGVDRRELFSDSAYAPDRRPAASELSIARASSAQRISSYWRRVADVGRELRSRDLLKWRIILDSSLTEDEKMDRLYPVYDGYSELEHEFECLIAEDMGPSPLPEIDPVIQKKINEFAKWMADCRDLNQIARDMGLE